MGGGGGKGVQRVGYVLKYGFLPLHAVLSSQQLGVVLPYSHRLGIVLIDQHLLRPEGILLRFFQLEGVKPE